MRAMKLRRYPQMIQLENRRNEWVQCGYSAIRANFFKKIRYRSTVTAYLADCTNLDIKCDSIEVNRLTLVLHIALASLGSRHSTVIV